MRFAVLMFVLAAAAAAAPAGDRRSSASSDQDANHRGYAAPDGDAELLERLREATDGLHFPSEHDELMTPFVCEARGATGFAPSDAIRLVGAPPSARVEALSFEELFRGPTTVREWHRDGERRQVERFRELVALLKSSLSDLRVFRIGRLTCDVVVVGRSRSGAFVGVRTRVVET